MTIFQLNTLIFGCWTFKTLGVVTSSVFQTNFQGSKHNLQFCLRAKDFPMQIFKTGLKIRRFEHLKKLHVLKVTSVCTSHIATLFTIEMGLFCSENVR